MVTCEGMLLCHLIPEIEILRITGMNLWLLWCVLYMCVCHLFHAQKLWVLGGSLVMYVFFISTLLCTACWLISAFGVIDFLFPLSILFNSQQFPNVNTQQVLSACVKSNNMFVVQKPQLSISGIYDGSHFFQNCVGYQERGLAWHDLNSNPALLLSWNAQGISALKSSAVSKTKLNP